MRSPGTIIQYFLGIAASTSVFAIINYRHFHRLKNCADCFFPYGWPYTIYHDGGYAGGAGFVWTGVVADLLIVIALGIAIAWIWTKIFEQRLTSS